ncbi:MULTISPECIES: hypothetical protein [unclassified Variovorax]|uniref:hypothetical protein n=1 Tax=unclassified Variovorax TaxID=663243 RepID=UPI0013183C61|nr:MULTISPECIES: hypothetical protein [unclassified Variovorax]VTU42614.1 hypothetical protein H6P1_00235 [Variovorax sp. PBL-H6]VTU43805.1 hypothetical protein SRS16P1_00668 [Variovorax sp. SRS16]VTU43870.1 hypothetical protein E5P1_00661 [Variovorax sp. PBL-E5]
MLKPFLRSVSYLVMASLLFTGMPAPMPKAFAQAAPISNCANVLAADQGMDPACSAKRFGSQVVAYPKLQWERIAEVPAPTVTTGGGVLPPSTESLAMANRAAIALGVPSSEVTSAVQMFPSNVPFVFARYNPLDNTMSVDIFKLEKGGSGNSVTSGLYHAKFAPSHGNFWKASGAYLDPQRRIAGDTPGLNPFEAFTCPASTTFCNLSVSGAQVVVGHAMRYVGAPLSVLAVAQTRFDQTQTKSGNAFKKKVTTKVYGMAKPAWLIGYPAQFQARSSTIPMAAYCANDPRATTCALYQTASAGVMFEQYEGGSLSAYEDAWLIDQWTKSGLGWLAVLVVAVVLSFTVAGIGAAVGLNAAAATGAVTSGVATGVMGGYLAAAGVTMGSLAMSVAVEAALIGGAMMLGGADLSGPLKFGYNAIYGQVENVKGYNDPPNYDKNNQLLNMKVVPLTHNEITGNAYGNALTGFATTFQGTCPPGAALANCAGATGVIQHADQYIEQNQVQFLRDNGGKIVRNDAGGGFGQ